MVRKPLLLDLVLRLEDGNDSEGLLKAESGPCLRVGMLQEGNGSRIVNRSWDVSRPIGACIGCGLCTSQLQLCNKVPPTPTLHKPLLTPVSEGWTSGHLLNGLGAPEPLKASSVPTAVPGKVRLRACSHGSCLHIPFLIKCASPALHIESALCEKGHGVQGTGTEKGPFSFLSDFYLGGGKSVVISDNNFFLIFPCELLSKELI